MTPAEARAILNVREGSDRETIDRAYRRRARMTHPDRFAGAPKADLDAASEEFIRIGLARDVLREQAATAGPRSTDGSTHGGSRHTPPPKPASTPPPNQHRNQRQARPTMTFEQFMAKREAAQWSRDPADYWRNLQMMPRQRRVPSGLIATLAVLAVIVGTVGVAAASAGGWSPGVAPTPPPRAIQFTDLTGGRSLDCPTTMESCWGWRIEPGETCAAAQLEYSLYRFEEQTLPDESGVKLIGRLIEGEVRDVFVEGEDPFPLASLDRVLCNRG